MRAGLHLVDNSFSLIGGIVFLIEESDSKSNSSPRPTLALQGRGALRVF